MAKLKALFMRILLALNMFVLHLLTGQSDLTISGWSYIRVRKIASRRPRDAICVMNSLSGEFNLSMCSQLLIVQQVLFFLLLLSMRRVSLLHFEISYETQN